MRGGKAHPWVAVDVKLADGGHLVKTSRGEFDAFGSVRLFTLHQRTKKSNQHDSGGATPTEVMLQYEADKARKMKADADIAEITADLMAGRVHEGRAVEELWMSQLMSARSKFLSVPSKLAALLPPELAAPFLIESEAIKRRDQHLRALAAASVKMALRKQKRRQQR